MKLRTFFIVITGSLLLMNCGGTRGEGFVGEIIHVNGELPEETESIDLFWAISAQPDASKLSMKTLEFNEDKSKMSFIPDAAGKYVFEMEIFQYGDELETQKFTYNVDSVEPLVASETEDEALAEEEDEDWLEEEYEEELEYEYEDDDYDYAEVSEDDEEEMEENEDEVAYDVDEEEELEETEKTEEIELAAVEISPKVVTPKPAAAKPAKKKRPRYVIPFDKSRYTIQVVSKKNLRDAEKMAANLIESGYDAYIQKAYFRDTDEVWFRVRVGSYDNRETALAVGKVIASAMTTDIWVDFVRFED